MLVKTQKKTNHWTKKRVKGSSFCTSGWDVCVRVGRTGSRDAVAVCTSGAVDMLETDIDTSLASGSSVTSGDKVWNTCTGDTVVSSWAGRAGGAVGALESSEAGCTVADVCTAGGVSGIIWLVGGVESCSAFSSVAEGESSSSAEGVWPDDGGKASCWSLSKPQKEERNGVT